MKGGANYRRIYNIHVKDLTLEQFKMPLGQYESGK